jgi:hypothetical protein
VYLSLDSAGHGAGYVAVSQDECGILSHTKAAWRCLGFKACGR